MSGVIHYISFNEFGLMESSDRQVIQFNMFLRDKCNV